MPTCTAVIVPHTHTILLQGNGIIPKSDVITLLTFENGDHKNDLSVQASGRKKQVRIKGHNDTDNNLQQNISLS